MSRTVPGWAVALCAAATIGASLAGQATLVYVFKPLTTLLLLAVALRAAAPVSPRYRAAIVVGMALSLAGDVFLMLPGPYFLHGLVAFLLAHCAYLVALTADVRLAARARPFAAVALVAAALLAVLWPGVPPAMRLAVVAYVALLGAMAAQSVARHQVLRRRDSWLAAVGGLLFMSSDTLLAFNRFHTPLPLSPLWVLGTYYGAQWLIARSVSQRSLRVAA